jgi:isoquinoline 1-oxidoreductase beta subunit
VVAEVAVDDAGTVRVTGLWCAHDCGRVVNPDQVRAQCEGNLVWGLGMVLGDRLPVVGGVPAATGFADAPIPTTADVPDIAVDLMPSDAPPTGAGETAIVAAPGAIANAVRAATGVRPTRFPLDRAAFRVA